MADNAGLAFAASLTDESVKRVAEEIRNEFRSMSKTAAEEGSKMDNVFKKLGGYIGGYFSIKAATDFGKQIVKVRGEIESLEVSFKTLLGDEKKAVSLMSDIRKFAASTPMQMNDLAAGAQTLLGFNVEAEKIMPTLQALGDISMGDSAKFNALTLAFAQMSSTGKLMGQDLMQMINAGFNPLAQISETTGKSIATLKDEMSKGQISVEMVTQAFMDATSEGGKFYKMLEQQSEGIRGSLSNLQGAVNDMMNDLGEKTDGVVVDTVKLLQKLVQNYETVGKVIGTLVATYGGYKAAVMAYNAAMVVATNVTKGYTIAQQAEYVWLLLVEKAQALLNKTMLKNPYVLAATAIIALISALVLLKKRTSEAEQAQKAFDSVVNNQKEIDDERTNTINQLIQTIRDETQTVYARTEAYKKFAAMFPELFKQYKETGEITDEIRSKIDTLIAEPKKLNIEVEKQGTADLEELLKRYEWAQQTERELIGHSTAKKYFGFLNTFKEEAEAIGMSVNSGANFDKFIQTMIDETKKALAERKKAIEQAAFDAKPIEERIVITETSIKQVEASIAFLKRKAEADPWNPMLQLDISLAEQQLQQLQNQLDGLTSQRKDPVKVDFAAEVRKAEAELRKARAAFRKDASESNRTAVTTAEGNVDTAKRNYKAATGKDYDQTVKAGQDRLKAQKEANAALKKEQEEYAEWLAKQAQQAVFDRRQAEIDAMKNGLPKTLAQIALDYEQQLAAVKEQEKDMVEHLRDLKEAEWEAANPDAKKKGDTYDRSTITAADLTPDQQQQITDATKRAAQERARKEKAALEATLKDVQTYTQKRLALIEEYKRREEEMYEHDEQGNRTNLRSGFTQGNVDENSRQQSEALKGLDEEFASQQATYEAWCNQIAQWTYTQLAAVLEEAKVALEQAEGEFGVDSEEAALARQKVRDLENEMKKLRASGEATGDKLRDTFNELKPSLTKLAGKFTELGGQIEEVGETLEKDWIVTAGKALKAVGSVAQNAISIFDNILTLTQGTTTAIQTATTGATTAMATAAEGAAAAIHVVETASVILAVIGAALGIAQQIYSLFKSSAQKKHEEELAKIEDKIDDINDAYDDLDKQSKKTFGASNAEIRRQQVELKKAQIELLKTAIAEEKAQKNPDNDKIKEWQNQIKTLEGEMADLEEAAVDAIYGEDIKSAIESMAEAITDAWANGTSSALSAKEQARKYLKQIVLEAMKDTIAGSAMVERLREKILAYFNNAMRQSTANTLREIGRIDGALDSLHGGLALNINIPTWEDIEAESEELAEYLETIFGQFSHLWDDSDREGSKKGIATASQESVDENNGRLTFIQGAVTVMKEKVSNISDNSDIIRDNTTAILGSVLRIESNTDELTSIRSTLDDMQTQGIRVRS